FDQTQDGTDGLVAIISGDGSTKLYATYVGGTGDDIANGISLSSGSIDVAGYTNSTDFPLLNAVDPVAASFEGWFARFTPLEPYVVNSTADVVDLAIGDGICDTGNTVGPDPECTLRAAIQEANNSANDEIVLPAGIYTLSIFGTDDDASAGDLDILAGTIITGAGASTTIIQAGTNATNGIDRVFDVKAPGPAHIYGVTIRHGQESDGAGLRTVVDVTVEDAVLVDNTASNSGGGFFVDGSTASLTVRNSTMIGGSADDGGAIVVTDGTAAVHDSTLSANTAGRRGGAIYNDAGTVTVSGTLLDGNAGEDGGAIHNRQGDVTVADSTVSGNTATRLSGGIYSDGGPLTIDGSLLVANASTDDGGAINSQGGSAVLTVTNSTISGNSSGGNGGGIVSDRPATILNSTITLNTATGAGGGLNQANDIFELQNTIVAGNLSGGDCAGTFISLGNNIDGGTSCTLTQLSDQSTTDPMLSPLQDNGGPTSTHALTPSSPAIDGGNTAAAPTTDQRGVARPQDGNGDTTADSDIGSFELEPVPLKSASGTVFEDVFGDVLNDGTVGDGNNPGITNVDVHLYSDVDGDGIAEPSDTFVGTAQTDAGGNYVFNDLANGRYFVVVDSLTVQPTGGIDNGSGWAQSDVWAEQTYGPAISQCADGAGSTTDRPTAGPCYGGRRSGVSDDLTTWHSGAEHLGKIEIVSADVTDVDFGFSFNAITSTAGGDTQDDAPGNRSMQGTVRQFIWNANAILGPNTSKFVPADLTDDSAAGGTWWRVDVGSVLPTLYEPETALAGIAYDMIDGLAIRNPNPNGPELQIDGSALSGGEDGFYIFAGAAANRLEALAVTGFPDVGVVVNADDVSIVDSFIGVDPTG
ncbi:MAG: choice-of-anchor Q domain-containing protein, partial [Acidimicrobiia bacterium]